MAVYINENSVFLSPGLKRARDALICAIYVHDRFLL